MPPPAPPPVGKPLNAAVLVLTVLFDHRQCRGAAISGIIKDASPAEAKLPVTMLLKTVSVELPAEPSL